MTVYKSIKIPDTRTMYATHAARQSNGEQRGDLQTESYMLVRKKGRLLRLSLTDEYRGHKKIE